MTREEKEQAVEELRQLLVESPALVLASTAGLPVNKVNQLRSELRAKGARFQVVKNTLARRAIAGTHVEALADKFVGPIAVAAHPEEPGIAAKILLEFKSKADALEIKAGFDGADVLDPAGVEMLSKLPGRDELRAQIIGLLTSVPTKVVRVFTAAQRDTIGVLNARRNDLESRA